METYRRSGYQPASLRLGLGCALILPAALFGTAMLADFAGPRDWRGPAEFLGWWALCICASVWCAILLTRFGGERRGRFWFLVIALSSAAAFSALAIFAAHPATTRQAKLIFTTFLQVVGVASTAALLSYFLWLGWSSRRP